MIDADTRHHNGHADAWKALVVDSVHIPLLVPLLVSFVNCPFHFAASAVLVTMTTVRSLTKMTATSWVKVTVILSVTLTLTLNDDPSLHYRVSHSHDANIHGHT